MKYMTTGLLKKLAGLGLILAFIMIMQSVVPAFAAAPPADNPQSGSVGVTGTLPSAPPKTGATIATPSNGQTFTTIPITISGLCPDGLLVKIFDNNVFMGSVVCTGGSYSLKIDLFSGRNDLVARVFDALDQAGPDSNIITVNFNDSQFNTSGSSLLTLTSDYARRGANPGATLVWPIILSGGTGPYAISIDWGDNKPQDLMSAQFPGVVNMQHVYDTAGVYGIIVKATDKNGLTAYLQLVGVANGAITASSSTSNTGSNSQTTQPAKIIWWPALIMFPFIVTSFWLGKRYAITSLRRHLEREEY